MRWRQRPQPVTECASPDLILVFPRKSIGENEGPAQRGPHAVQAVHLGLFNLARVILQKVSNEAGSGRRHWLGSPRNALRTHRSRILVESKKKKNTKMRLVDPRTKQFGRALATPRLSIWTEGLRSTVVSGDRLIVISAIALNRFNYVFANSTLRTGVHKHS